MKHIYDYIKFNEGFFKPSLKNQDEIEKKVKLDKIVDEIESSKMEQVERKGIKMPIYVFYPIGKQIYVDLRTTMIMRILNVDQGIEYSRVMTFFSEIPSINISPNVPFEKPYVDKILSIIRSNSKN